MGFCQKVKRNTHAPGNRKTYKLPFREVKATLLLTLFKSFGTGTYGMYNQLLSLVGVKDALWERPCLKKGKAQKHGIARNHPDRRMNVFRDGQRVNQDGINPHAHHD